MKIIYTSILFLSVLALSCNNNKEKSEKETNLNSNLTILYENDNDSIILYTEYVDTIINERAIVQNLGLKDLKSGENKILLSTIKPDSNSWYIADGDRFIPISMDSITWISRAYVLELKPLKIIVEGCPDQRNEFSYFIDFENNQAWYVPSNSGFMGGTEEGYMIFKSYRYVSDPEIAGRYTVLQIFNIEGAMVDSLNLEHVIVDRYKNK